MSEQQADVKTIPHISDPAVGMGLFAPEGTFVNMRKAQELGSVVRIDANIPYVFEGPMYCIVGPELVYPALQKLERSELNAKFSDRIFSNINWISAKGDLFKKLDTAYRPYFHPDVIKKNYPAMMKIVKEVLGQL